MPRPDDPQHQRHQQQTEELFSGFTCSGRPVAAAAALANLDIIERDNLREHVQAVSPHFERHLRSLKDLPVVSEARVMGLMSGGGARLILKSG